MRVGLSKACNAREMNGTSKSKSEVYTTGPAVFSISWR